MEARRNRSLRNLGRAWKSPRILFLSARGKGRRWRNPSLSFSSKQRWSTSRTLRRRLPNLPRKLASAPRLFFKLSQTQPSITPWWPRGISYWMGSLCPGPIGEELDFPNQASSSSGLGAQPQALQGCHSEFLGEFPYLTRKLHFQQTSNTFCSCRVSKCF